MENGHRAAAQGEALAEISTGLVQLHARHYGKGPTRAKTAMVGDVVVCTLGDGFTDAERTMIDNGELEAVRYLRDAFQRGMKSAFTAVVERALRRRVIACMNQVHIDPDMSVEIFVLEPQAAYLMGH